MYRATATALALISFLPRIGVGVEPMRPCGPPPCGCELPPVACCEPFAPTSKAARPKRPAPKPTPADPAPAKPSTLPSPLSASPAAAPAPNADAISPPPLNTPAIVESPATDVTPPLPEAAPIESAPRYADPPAAAPSATTPTGFDEPFSDAPAASETAAPEPSSTETQPAEEQSPATETTPIEPATPAPAEDEPFPAPAEETTPAPAEETTPAPAEEPSSVTPDYDDLFPPSSTNEVLKQPGGWASDATRPWNDAEGQLLVTGRITEVTAKFVVLSREDGQSQAVRFARLGDDDLSFLRQQIEARRAQLASQADDDGLLARQSR